MALDQTDPGGAVAREGRGQFPDAFPHERGGHFLARLVGQPFYLAHGLQRHVHQLSVPVLGNDPEAAAHISLATRFAE
jgi:hypothetical protein